MLIDDRLFERAEGTGSGPSQLTPIVINDNLLDFVITPGKAGEWLKSFLVRQRTGTAIATTAPIILAERMTDGQAPEHRREICERPVAHDRRTEQRGVLRFRRARDLQHPSPPLTPPLAHLHETGSVPALGATTGPGMDHEHGRLQVGHERLGARRWCQRETAGGGQRPRTRGSAQGTRVRSGGVHRPIAPFHAEEARASLLKRMP